MWLQACLNGSRTVIEHPAVPVTPGALADDARRVLHAGAAAVHVHPRDTAGEGWGGGAGGRVAAIAAWTRLPDFVSVNLAEPGIEHVVAICVRRQIGLEAGIWTVEDARHLLTLTDTPWLRLLLEPWESDAHQANAMGDAIEAVLGDALPGVPRLVHGTDDAAWALLKRAIRDGYPSRVVREATLLLPTGEPVLDNVTLVRLAGALASSPEH